MALNCPKCGMEVQSPPEREWKFHQYRVSRFQCSRGDKFNLYSGKSRTFTIPRSGMGIRMSIRVCTGCNAQNPDEAVFCKNCGSKL